MTRNVLHPSMLKRLHRRFTDTCTIEQDVPEQDEYGAEVERFDKRNKHANIPVALATLEGAGGLRNREQKESDGIWTRATHMAVLQGRYDDITEKDRLRMSDDSIFDILLVEGDSQGVYTRLTLEVLT